MDVGAGDVSERPTGRVPRERSAADRPALAPTTVEMIAVPARWPEAAAYRAGRRLAAAEADEVPMMLRQGLPVDVYLKSDELAAVVELREPVWSRWFSLGWATETSDREGG